MRSKLVWTNAAWEDYVYWQSQDKKTLKRINLLVKEVMRDPEVGIGKKDPAQVLQKQIKRMVTLSHLIKQFALHAQLTAARLPCTNAIRLQSLCRQSGYVHG